MIPERMRRTARYAAILLAAVAAAMVVAACGTQATGVSRSDPAYVADSAAAHLFNERCGGCHSLSYAGTYGSGQNPRTYEAINGPNFNVRCERSGGAMRVLYAIENGGFSGAYMPQNIVVGKQARELANFVARYAGRLAPKQPGVTPCDKQPLNPLPLTGPLPQLSASAGATGKTASAGKATAGGAAKTSGKSSSGS